MSITKNISLVVYTFFLSSLAISTSVPKAIAEIPEPECQEAVGESACGYNCELSGDGMIARCADWPGGKCLSRLSNVACGPPAPVGWEDRYESSDNFDLDRDRNRGCDCDCDCDRR